tara:strand:+ start:4630 stop:5070 length:441 start_codon:yes stop_codon:yes gene_type:complete
MFDYCILTHKNIKLERQLKKREEEINRLTALNATPNEKEDQKTSILLLVDTSKTLIQLMMGLVIAILGFYQFALKELGGYDSLIWAAGAMAYSSIWLGLLVHSRAYQQGYDSVWSIIPIRRLINIQAPLSLLSLGSFVYVIATINP